MISTAKRIPEGIRRTIVTEQFIEKVQNAPSINSPMQFLFDVYLEFIDPSGMHGNWECARCRQKVIDDFKRLQPYLIKLVNT
jgi:hypothetical protein